MHMKTSSGNSQLGGTLLGLIIGLVVGLGVALAVALYITKAPVPFVDRGVQRPNTSDAVEAERARDWNPNQSLSRTAPAVAPSDTSSTPSIVPPGGTSLPPAGSTDSIGQLIQQRATAASSSTTVAPVDVTAAPDPFIYYVQVGAYRNPEEANAQRARMAMSGFETQVSEREQGGRQVYRVRMGPYESRAEAESIEQQLRTQGVDTALVRVQR
jgi:cell division protein FtsN